MLKAFTAIRKDAASSRSFLPSPRKRSFGYYELLQRADTCGVFTDGTPTAPADQSKSRTKVRLWRRLELEPPIFPLPRRPSRALVFGRNQGIRMIRTAVPERPPKAHPAPLVLKALLLSGIGFGLTLAAVTAVLANQSALHSRFCYNVDYLDRAEAAVHGFIQ